MKVSSSITPAMKEQIQKDSKTRGYNQALSEQYIQDRSVAASNAAKTGDIVFGGVVSAMAAKIALDAKSLYNKCSLYVVAQMVDKTYTTADGNGVFVKKELSFSPLMSKMKAVKMSAKKQFAPFMKEIKKVPINKEEGFGLKWIAKESVIAVKLLGTSLKGTWKSIPPVVRIPAAILLGAIAVKAIQDKATIDAKYDTLQYLENKKA